MSKIVVLGGGIRPGVLWTQILSRSISPCRPLKQEVSACVPRLGHDVAHVIVVTCRDRKRGEMRANLNARLI